MKTRTLRSENETRKKAVLIRNYECLQMCSMDTKVLLDKFLNFNLVRFARWFNLVVLKRHDNQAQANHAKEAIDEDVVFE